MVSTAATTADEMQEVVEEGTSTEGEAYDPYNSDPYENAGMQKIQMIEQAQQTTLESRLKSMDLQDIVATLVLPSIALFAAARWGFNRVSRKVQASSDATIKSFAKEMLYHDGNLDEMRLCIKDYKKRLTKTFHSSGKRLLILFLLNLLKR